MPAILPRDAWDVWLDPGVQDGEALRELLQPYPADEMLARYKRSGVSTVRTMVDRSMPEVEAFFTAHADA